MIIHPLGIHFGLPFDDYLADPGLSSTDMRRLIVSPLNYWIDSHLNPDREEEEDKASLSIGRAFHARIVEGAEAFNSRYAIELNADNFPDALKSADDLRTACKNHNIKAGNSKAKMSEALRQAGAPVVIWDDLVADHEAKNPGKEFIKQKLWDRIERAAKLVAAHPVGGSAFAGGYPEVSIFWEDPETGIRLKARIDYLKTKALIDLKTFTNLHNKPLKKAVAHAVANHSYHVQVCHYCDGAEAAKKMLRKDRSLIFGEAPPAEWIDAFLATKRHGFVFVFQEAGRVPNVVVREFTRSNGHDQNLYWISGETEVRAAINIFNRCREQYGDGPWLGYDETMEAFEDRDFPSYMMEF